MFASWKWAGERLPLHPYGLFGLETDTWKKGLYLPSQYLVVGSFVWKKKKIKSLSPLLHQGIRWKIGNGKPTNLWYYKWIFEGSLHSLFRQHNHLENAFVSSSIAENTWSIPTSLPAYIRDKSRVAFKQSLLPALPNLIRLSGPSHRTATCL